MPRSEWQSKVGLQVAVRGVGLGPVLGVILGPAVPQGIIRRPAVALAVRAPWTEEWTPLVASPRQVLMPWERWCALRRAALTDHPWPTDAVRRLVEVVPEATRRMRLGGGEREYSAFVVDASAPSQRLIANMLLSIPGFRVEVFDAAAKAVQRSLETPPDITVMVVRDGLGDAITQMRAAHEQLGHRASPVVWCVTAVPPVEQAEEAARLGLRAVMTAPWRLEAFVVLTLRVCREGERERYLLERGVSPEQIASRLLDAEGTRLWVEAETRLATGSARQFALVNVGADSSEVLAAVRGAIRAGDMVGRAVDGGLTVLLPDVDEGDARSVATRVARSVDQMQPRPPVACVTRHPDEDATGLLSRLAAESGHLSR
jgi:CheY-like chemotaxis protein